MRIRLGFWGFVVLLNDNRKWFGDGGKGIHEKNLGANITEIIVEALEKENNVVGILSMMYLIVKGETQWVAHEKNGVGRRYLSSS